MKKLNNKKLVALCYAGFLLASLLLAVVQLGMDAFWRSTGKMGTLTLTADAFETLNLEQQPDGSLVTTTDDPRMMLQNCPERVSRVEVQVKFINLDPGEFTLSPSPIWRTLTPIIACGQKKKGTASIRSGCRRIKFMGCGLTRAFIPVFRWR